MDEEVSQRAPGAGAVIDERLAEYVVLGPPTREEGRKLAVDLQQLRRALREAGEALEYVIKDNDAWIKCGIDSLVDPEWASACANPEQVRSEEREEIERRQMHATTLRSLARIASLASSASFASPDADGAVKESGK